MKKPHVYFSSVEADKKTTFGNFSWNWSRDEKPHVYFSSAKADKKNHIWKFQLKFIQGWKNLIWTFHQLKQIKKLHLEISAKIDPGMKKPHVHFSSIYSMTRKSQYWQMSFTHLAYESCQMKNNLNSYAIDSSQKWMK